MSRVLLVAVLTFRRPADLAVLLPMLVEQVRTVDLTASVLVVDNDPEGSARPVVTAAGGPVRYVQEVRPGIAAARNRALEEAREADLLVFIDDDERPSPTWLRSLVATYDALRPTAVVGPVVSEFAVEPDDWVAAGAFFDRRRLPTGTEVAVAATNNLLLDLEQVGDLRFDERFGLSGGSDTLFSADLVARGGRMVWCAEAMVTDWVPAKRLSRRWVLQRAFRSGNGWSRVVLEVAPGGLARLQEQGRLLARGLLRVLGGSGRIMIGTLTRSLRHQARGTRTFMRGAGMMTGALGYVYEEYKRTERPPGLMEGAAR